MLIALLAFVILLAAGLYLDELQWRHVAVAIVVALGSLTAIVLLGWQPAFFTIVLCLIDVVLILAIFKGDITIRG